MTNPLTKACRAWRARLEWWLVDDSVDAEHGSAGDVIGWLCDESASSNLLGPDWDITYG